MAGPRNLPDPDLPGGPDRLVALSADLIYEWKTLRPVLLRLIRLRYWTVGTGAVVAAALIAAGVVAFILIGRNTATVAGVHANNVTACRAANTQLAVQQRALDAILAIGGRRKNLSPARRAEEQRFEARARGYVAAGWAPHNCRKLYSLKGGR